MARRLGFGLFAVLAVLVAPLSSWAQVQSGSIHVKATDEQNSAVPGATVTLTSSVLPSALTAVTDSTGIARFTSLQVGTYATKITLQGFQTVTRTDIVVVQGQTVALDFTMKVGALTEEVTVKAESPVVDTKAANVSVNLDARLLDTTPGGKDIWSILEIQDPGDRLRHAGRRRQSGRPAARVHVARHAELAERAAAQRRQRRRSRRRSASR